MITAIFNNKMDSTIAYGLWQWDYGQVLRIKGIDFSQFAIEIHFSFNEDDEDSTIAVGVVKEVEYESTILDDGETKVTSETIQVLDVTIPKDFLWNRNKKNYTIYVFLHLSNEEIGHTVKKILLPVKIKARPTYPHASEDEALFHSTLEQINELAETTVENAKMAKSYAVGDTGTREGEDTDNAKYYAEQASVSLEEATLQAENAEQSANNAKEYEENAELSANKAKEYELSSKTNADNAQGYMDWAYEYKDNAQEYSISARDYRDEAESAKNISLQASIDTGKVRDEVKDIQTDVKNIQTQINNTVDSVDDTIIEINELAEQVKTDARTVATNTEITNQNKIATNEAKATAEEVLASSRQINADVLEIKNQIIGFADDATKIVNEGIAEHNTSSTAHDDIRQLIVGLNDRLNTVLNSDDETLDQLSEIVDYIKDNRDLIDTITTSKVNVNDIIDNLTTMSSNKPLSAKQGKILKDLIDAIVIPTKVSAFENDKGYLTEHQSLEEYVKNTDYATTDKGGVIKTDMDKGLMTLSDGTICIAPAMNTQIKKGTLANKAVVPVFQHYATFYGLAKAAGDTTQSTSDNAVGTYTNEAKIKIKSMIGVPTKVSELTNDSGYLTEQVQTNWTEEDSTNASFIQNKPNIKSGTGTGSIVECRITGDFANVASGSYAHAEGSGTIASGYYSHAEGAGAESNGNCSHAEGGGTIASGFYSHSENYGATASGHMSHAEGVQTISGGYGSHAEGQGTKSASRTQHAQGRYNIEDTNETYAHIVGNGTSDSERSNAHTLDWNGNAWYAGKVTADGTPTNDNDLVSKKWVEDKGYLTEQAQSDWTETDNTSASYVQNKPSIASGTGTDSVIVGGISGANANKATAPYSYAEGFQNASSGIGAHAEGNGTTSSGLASHSEGYITLAAGRDAHSEGTLSQANANNSHAEGYKTIVDGSSGHAEGRETRASAYFTHSEGYGTVATSQAQHVQGQYNVLDTEGSLSTQGRYAHIVGNGTADDARSNAHTLDWYGNAWYQGKVTAEGTPTESNDLVPKSYVDGTLTDYVKNTDYATADKGGVIKVPVYTNGYRGGMATIDGTLYSIGASIADIKLGIDLTKPLSAQNSTATTFYGLARASGDTTQSVSDNTIGNYTDEAKASIQEMLDVPSTEQLEDYTTLNTFYDDVIDNTTSGNNIVSFNDGANNLPIQDLIINIEPNQDLHGYDSPWPSGGGINMLDISTCTEGKRLDNVGNLVNGASYATSDWILIEPNTDYCIRNAISASSGYAFCFYDSDKTFLRYAVLSGTSPINGVRNSGENAAYARVTVVLASIENSMVAKSSSIIDFSPYSNICPISGWEGCEVVQTGKNLIPKGIKSVGTFKPTGGTITGSVYETLCFPVPKGRLHWKVDTTGVCSYICLLDDIPASGVTVYNNVTVTNRSEWNLDNSAGHKYMAMFTSNFGKTEEEASAYITEHEICVTYGDDTEFTEPVISTITPISWKSEAGTIYGGVLDVLTGKLSINRLLYKGGWEKYNENENYNIYRQTFPLASPTPKHMSNVIGKFGAFVSSTVSENIIQPPSSTGTRGFMALRKDLSADDVEYSFVMATPIEIQLDPHTLNTLLGYNNIYTDINSNISITYKANTKAYIDNKVMDNVPDLTSYVKNTNYATTTVGGVIKVSGTYGSGIDSNGILYIYKASDAEVKAGTNSYKPITPNSQHGSVFYGLAKASGDTTQASSANAIGVYTNDAKTKIKTMLDIPTKTSELTNDSNFINTSYQIYATDDDNGNVTIHFGIPS